MMTFSTMIEGPDGAFGAYVANPSQPNGAAIVVLQEIFGVSYVMREVADHYAAQGYLAIVPDLFWRLQPGVQLTHHTPEEWQQAFDLFGKFDIESGVKDVQMTIDYARTHATKVGAIGFCMGGLLAYLSGTRTNIDASVSYYGVSLEKYLGETAQVKAPLMLHVAGEDKYVPADVQADIARTANDHPMITAHFYQGVDHAFARKNGEHFDAVAAALAEKRSQELFAKALIS